jgi:ADP-heptose:LPS heptosyltransferase
VEETVDLEALGLHRLFTATADPAALQPLAGYAAVVSWLGAGDAAYREHLGAMAERPGCRVVIARAAPPPGSTRHAAWHLLDTLGELGPPPADLPPVRLTAGAGERDWAAGWLEERGLAPGTVAVLHPGAGNVAKVWPGFPTLARRLAILGLPVVVVTGPAEAGRVAGLAAAAGVPGARVARDLSVRQLAALFERAAVFVGNDSGLSHLAAAVGCASLVLFGPTDPVVWAPIGLRVRVVRGSGPRAADPWHGMDVGRVERAALDLARGSAVGVG